jgi:hypothetical protein
MDDSAANEGADSFGSQNSESVSRWSTSPSLICLNKLRLQNRPGSNADWDDQRKLYTGYKCSGQVRAVFVLQMEMTLNSCISAAFANY